MTHLPPSSSKLTDLLEELRRAEKEQALFYRAMSALAESTDHPSAARFHDLHADEQHHLSRLTARLLELGGRPADLGGLRAEATDLGRHEAETQLREAEEIRRYSEALARPDLDDATRALLEQILEVEEHHAAQHGGKWTMA